MTLTKDQILKIKLEKPIEKGDLSGRVVFAHTPRTGGISIVEHLTEIYEKYNYDNIWVIGHNLRNKNYMSLPKYCDIYGKDFKTFAFVRNPWERVVSAFNYLKKGGCCEPDKLDYEKYLAKFNEDFDLFVKEGLAKDKNILRQIHFTPQHVWLCGSNDNVVVDFLGRYENLERDYKTVAKLYNFPTFSLKKENSSKHDYYKKYYNKETKKFIKKILKFLVMNFK